MRNDDLSFTQKLVGNTNAFIQQTTGIAAQIKDEAFEITELVQRFHNFMLRCFIEGADMHVTDSGANLKFKVNTVARDFRPDQVKVKGLLSTFAQDIDAHIRAFGPFQKIYYIAGI